MQILLTGASGLVGKSILKDLLAAGHSIIALGRTKLEEQQGLQWIHTDLNNINGDVFGSLPKVDAVVHNAAAILMAKNSEELNRLQKVNIDFSSSLFKWAGSNGCKKIVYTSSVNFLRRPLEPIITEEHPIGATIPYGLSKYWSELELGLLAKEYDLNGIALRISSPICFDFESLHDNVVKKWIISASAGNPITLFGKGSRTQDFVTAQDVAAGINRALSTSVSGVFNITSGTSISMEELATLIAKKYPVSISKNGEDPNEAERWNISIEKAAKVLGYIPKYSSSEAIQKLLEGIK